MADITVNVQALPTTQSPWIIDDDDVAGASGPPVTGAMTGPAPGAGNSGDVFKIPNDGNIVVCVYNKDASATIIRVVTSYEYQGLELQDRFFNIPSQRTIVLAQFDTSFWNDGDGDISIQANTPSEFPRLRCTAFRITT